MKIDLSKVLIGINILALLLVLIVYFAPVQALRIILGIPFLLFSPGFVLAAAISPQKNGITNSERIILSFVLSIIVVSFTGLLLNYVWEIGLDSILFSVSLFIIAASVIALWRQLMLPKNERAVLEFNLTMTGNGSYRMDNLLSIIMLVVVVIALVAGLYYTFALKEGESFTQFYIMRQDGGTDFPEVLRAGEQISIFVVIVNHEGEDINYRAEAQFNGEVFEEINSIALSDEQRWQDEITFVSNTAGKDQCIEFLLFKDDETEPYLDPLSLVIDIVE